MISIAEKNVTAFGKISAAMRSQLKGNLFSNNGKCWSFKVNIVSFKLLIFPNCAPPVRYAPLIYRAHVLTW